MSKQKENTYHFKVSDMNDVDYARICREAETDNPGVHVIVIRTPGIQSLLAKPVVTPSSTEISSKWEGWVCRVLGTGWFQYFYTISTAGNEAIRKWVKILTVDQRLRIDVELHGGKAKPAVGDGQQNCGLHRRERPVILTGTRSEALRHAHDEIAHLKDRQKKAGEKIIQLKDKLAAKEKVIDILENNY